MKKAVSFISLTVLVLVFVTATSLAAKDNPVPTDTSKETLEFITYYPSPWGEPSGLCL